MPTVPMFSVRAVIDEDEDISVIIDYIVDAMSQIIEVSKKASMSVIPEAQNEIWSQYDWDSPSAQIEENLRAVLEHCEPEEIRSIANYALSVAANGLTNLHAQDLYIAMANVLVHELASE